MIDCNCRVAVDSIAPDHSMGDTVDLVGSIRSVASDTGHIELVGADSTDGMVDLVGNIPSVVRGDIDLVELLVCSTDGIVALVGRTLFAPGGGNTGLVLQSSQFRVGNFDYHCPVESILLYWQRICVPDLCEHPQ